MSAFWLKAAEISQLFVRWQFFFSFFFEFSSWAQRVTHK